VWRHLLKAAVVADIKLKINVNLLPFWFKKGKKKVKKRLRKVKKR